jgi:phosphoribosylamine--glycine ligase
MFTKELLERHRIPTATWRRFDRSGLAKSYLETVKTWPQVVKADGLAAGKGVFICKDLPEARAAVDALMEEKRLGEAGVRIVIEEFLEGQEVSVMALTDGHTLLMLEPAVDHKQVGDGDTGPNTGGMGVVAPAPFVGKRLALAIEQRVFLPLLHALNLEEIPFRGVLFAGLMVSDAGPKVLEFNVRFGDPETQAVLRRLESDLFPYLLATAEGKLEEQEPPRWSPGVSVCVVGCAAGYPGEVRRGDPITGLERLDQDPRAVLFQAGTKQEGRHVVTNGGRVLCATGSGEDLEQAREQAYGLLKRVHFAGLFFRRDIGQRPVRSL